MTARRSGRAALSKLATSDIDVDSSSGPNSPSIDGSFDDLSLEGRKGKKGALRNLKAKTDETSLFMSDFDPTKGRKARAKVKDTAYKDSHVGIVGNKNRSVKKDCLYDAKGALLWVSTLQIIYWCHYYYYYSFVCRICRMVEISVIVWWRTVLAATSLVPGNLKCGLHLYHITKSLCPDKNH